VVTGGFWYEALGTVEQLVAALGTSAIWKVAVLKPALLAWSCKVTSGTGPKSVAPDGSLQKVCEIWAVL